MVRFAKFHCFRVRIVIREYIAKTQLQQSIRESVCGWVGVYVCSYMNGNVSFCVAYVRYLSCHGGWACVCVCSNGCEHCLVYLAGVGLCCMFGW